MLAYHCTGQGLPVVLLHGWGFWGGIWSEVQAELAKDCQVFSVDLPGYGQSEAMADYSLTHLARLLVTQLPLNQPALWLGWSLGGLLALAVARDYPAHCRALLLVASTPCFVQREDWPHAVPLPVLDAFGQQVKQNHPASLNRFLTLQVQGSLCAQQQLRSLRQQFKQQPTPALTTLQAGLDLLKYSDLRQTMLNFDQDIGLFLGERDTLIPKELAEVYQNLPNVTRHCIKGAGHIPFLSHQTVFLTLLKTYLTTRNTP
jgi:pimeloyl-[acyl-carrier protein] methyl ester esterase